ncbi:hypothetical protein D9756_011453 [Leucocoprinus leucothites]|uniref:Ribonuclease H1 N-terminal domain-containing protein n=1 Tax=Leucocoprinus leucothites TaxID=201217 RepID=A0A8H5CN79_9AGAR|nr:hypothetical protein D9756_011453 [Leucoagaricus leucothites]
MNWFAQMPSALCPHNCSFEMRSESSEEIQGNKTFCSHYIDYVSNLTKSMSQLKVLSGDEWKSRYNATSATDSPQVTLAMQPKTPPPGSRIQMPATPVHNRFTRTVVVASPQSPKRQNFAAYIIFCSKQVGIFTDWAIAKPYTIAWKSRHTPSLKPIYKGYMTIHQAATIFKLALQYSLVGEEGQKIPPVWWPDDKIGFDIKSFPVPQLTEGTQGDNVMDITLSDFIAALPILLMDDAYAKIQNILSDEDTENDNEFFVVMHGKNIGVFRNWAITEKAISKSGKAKVASFDNRANANHAFTMAFMTSDLICYNDDGTICQTYGPFLNSDDVL